MADIRDRTQKKIFTLLTFTYGDLPNIVRYTDQNTEITYGGLVYTPHPGFKITYPEFTGGLNEKPLSIKLASNPFLDSLASDEPWPEVQINLSEITESIGGSRTEDIRFAGVINHTIRNDKNIKNKIKLVVDSVKNLLDVPLGMVATHQCNNRWGGPTCGFTLSTVTQPVTIVCISNTEVIIDVPPTYFSASSEFDDEFVKGFFEFDKLKILIRDWNKTAPTIFYTNRNPPKSWLNQTINLISGCNLSHRHCLRWGREEQFTGIGISTPAIFPPIENDTIIGDPKFL